MRPPDSTSRERERSTKTDPANGSAGVQRYGETTQRTKLHKALPNGSPILLRRNAKLSNARPSRLPAWVQKLVDRAVLDTARTKDFLLGPTVDSSAAPQKSALTPSNPTIRNGVPFELSGLALLEGKVPQDIKGTLFRNGPAVVERDRPVGHLFDGDGAVLAVHFDHGNVSAKYRFVETRFYQKEQRAGKFLFPSFGFTPDGPLWRRNALMNQKNAANTNILPLKATGEILALYESGHATAMTQELETLGAANIRGLGAMETMGAHPKVDPKTGAIYEFGVNRLTVMNRPGLELFQLSQSGAIEGTRVKLPTDQYPFVHDIVMAGDHLVVPIPPIDMDTMGVLTLRKTPMDAVEWNADKPTQLWIVPKQALQDPKHAQEPIRIDIPGVAAFHYCSGRQDGQHLSFLGVVHDDFSATMQILADALHGSVAKPNTGRLVRFDVDLETKEVSQHPMSSNPLEFPVIDARGEGNAGPSVWVAAASSSFDVFDTYQRFDRDHLDGPVDQYRFEGAVQEPIFVPKVGADGKEDATEAGYLVGVVYVPTPEGGRSEVVILDAQELNKGPVARLGLPEVIPMGLHGTWLPSHEAAP